MTSKSRCARTCRASVVMATVESCNLLILTFYYSILSSDGTLSSFDTSNGHLLSSYVRCHNGDIHCVDVIGGDTAISGSRDATIKVSVLNIQSAAKRIFQLENRDM
jgi:WD40 repeat protein